MIAEVMSAVNAIRAATDILKASLDAKTFLAVQGTLIDITTKLAAAQQSGLLLQQQNAVLHAEKLQLQDELAAARKEIDRLRAWDEERPNYALQEVAPGAFAYVHKPLHEVAGQPAASAHWLCCRCYDERRKSILQFARHEGGCRVYVCHCCQASISVRVPAAGATVETVPRTRRMF